MEVSAIVGLSCSCHREILGGAYFDNVNEAFGERARARQMCVTLVLSVGKGNLILTRTQFLVTASTKWKRPPPPSLERRGRTGGVHEPRNGNGRNEQAGWQGQGLENDLQLATAVGEHPWTPLSPLMVRGKSPHPHSSPPIRQACRRP